ncbi:hypothetical protein ABE10_31510 [Bacillus toyonensis]|nr:hypothetical protein [Bacillus toyonensis]
MGEMSNDQIAAGDLSLSGGVSRRTIVKGAAWSIPVIAATSAVPMASASGTLKATLTIPSGCVSPGGALPDAVVSVTDDSGVVTDATVTFTFASADGGVIAIGGSQYPTPNATLVLPQGQYTLSGVTATTSGTVKVTATASTPDGRTATALTQAYAVCTTQPSGINWGRNTRGELGRDIMDPGHPGNWDPMVGANLPAGVTVVSVGRSNTAAYIMASDGNVYSTGSSANYALGRPGGTSNVPAVIPELSGQNVVDVQSWAGDGNWNLSTPSLALTADGRVYSWGPAAYNGRGDGVSSTTPTLIPGLTDVKEIAVTETTGYALKNDGTVWVWGSNSFGRLGQNFGSDQATPVQLVAAGNDNVELTSTLRAGLVRKADGTVASWGSGINGVLGTGTNGVLVPESGNDSDSFSFYTVIPKLSGVTNIEAGPWTVFAILSDTTAKSWGDNWNGTLSAGLVDGNKYNTPQTVVRRNDAQRLYDGTDTPSGGWVTMTGIQQIAPIFYTTQFVLSNDEVWTTGDGDYGQWGWNPDNKPYSKDNDGNDRGKDLYGAGYNPNLSGRGIANGGAIYPLTDSYYATTVNDTKGSEHY